VEQIPYPTYEAKLTSEFSSGAGPDVFWVNTPFLAQFEQAGVMLNLKPLIAKAWQLEQWLGSAASQKIMGQGGYVWPAIPGLDPLFADYWAKKGVSMSGFLSESKGSLTDWPNTPGMNQALMDMQRDMGPIWLGPGTMAQTAANVTAAESDANHDLSAAGG
jgi:ABC-type glycerol-3-phosphate transport system substrate-binding protein